MRKRIRQLQDSDVKVAIKSVNHPRFDGVWSQQLYIVNDPDFPIICFSMGILRVGTKLDLSDHPVGLS